MRGLFFAIVQSPTFLCRGCNHCRGYWRGFTRKPARGATVIKLEDSGGFKDIIYKLFEAWEVDIVENGSCRGGLAAFGIYVEVSFEVEVEVDTEVRGLTTVGNCFLTSRLWLSFWYNDQHVVDLSLAIAGSSWPLGSRVFKFFGRGGLKHSSRPMPWNDEGL